MTNLLQIGLTAKDFEIPPGSLSISDDPAPRKGAKVYDLAKHGINPLPMKYPANREFAAALWPDKDLMTYRNGKRALAQLVTDYDRLDRIKFGKSDDDKEAKGVVDDIMLSPLLRAALRKRIPLWVFSGVTVLVRLNRKEIGDDDAKIAANILISQWPGQVVIDDFGAYAREHHAALIREERLIAGVYTLSELGEPKDNFRQRCMLMPKVGKGCIYDDAVELAKYAKLRPDPTREDNPYNRFIDEVMG
jgi:hypothetical protein